MVAKLSKNSFIFPMELISWFGLPSGADRWLHKDPKWSLELYFTFFHVPDINDRTNNLCLINCNIGIGPEFES